MEELRTIMKYHINDKSIYANILYKPNEDNLLTLTLYEENKSWSGEFSNELAKIHRERVLETEEEYYDNVMKALAKHPDFSYTFSVNLDDKNAATFSWNKKLGSAVLVHGSVVVHHDQVTKSKDSLLDSLSLENKQLKDSLNSLNLKHDKLNQDLKICVKNLEKATEVKESSEKVLYGKFVQLLNEKKRRIRLLQENLSKIYQFKVE